MGKWLSRVNDSVVANLIAAGVIAGGWYVWAAWYRLPLPIKAVVGLALFTLVVILLNEIRRRKVCSDWEESPSKDSFTLKRQEVLGWRLREIGAGTAHLQCDSTSQLELMQKLKAIFELAGWETNTANVPLENYPYQTQYYKGVLVKGYNRHLVDSVAEELKRSGIQNVATEIEPLALKRENPKWDGAQRTVRITVGH